MTSFSQKSYQKHATHYDEPHNSKNAHTTSWTQETSVDAWRHTRMYRTINPILETDVDANWLTVGDGRFGRDARYIQEHGGDALPTDISDTLLKQALISGDIQQYQVENAEALSFQDNAFDYVFCKESYHHFPRPMIALYEMLRVAKTAMILIEPNDQITTETPGAALVNWIKREIRSAIGKPEARNQFETSGNYLYTVSRREIEKVALGIGSPVVAFKGFNDAYIPGCELEPLQEKGPKYQKILNKIRRRDFLCRYHLLDSLLLTAIVFKSTPGESMVQALNTSGYDVVFLPENPYL